MKNRLISIIMAIAVLMSAFSVAVAAESYWDAQKAYIAALESGDGDAILDAVSRIEAVYPNPSDATEYSRVTFPQREAAFVYESRGQFDLAAERYGRFLSGIEALAGLGEDYSAYKNTVNMLYRHNAVTPTVYAETFDTSNIPNYGARNEDAAGVMHGMSGNFDENCDNARIMYVQFFDEDIEPFKWQIPKTEKDFLLMVAWNVPNEDVEDLRRINSGEQKS